MLTFLRWAMYTGRAYTDRSQNCQDAATVLVSHVRGNSERVAPAAIRCTVESFSFALEMPSNELERFFRASTEIATALLCEELRR